ncbi:MAG: hypothetical protein GTO45_10185 [Candidatus Aminicenantes bacterium]|nr:hypothetical protein [Candidatus Aminicenantes bacterium]NIM79178.1 hypothetical protein [Candidatus Aminicenantes bacterium]NIN18463.1 hypothetical protein [Candidatus Aminicenantes bacterium]NIN42351.1 hypothetical protein [Candidatus Aminicenantes bacterium]NIN85117.1 hypothetical protein [Candidatus Aminicenantes bacterium]
MTDFEETIRLNKEIIGQLVDLKKADFRILPFIGAGMSMPSGKPGWRGFLEEMLSFGINQKF